MLLSTLALLARGGVLELDHAVLDGGHLPGIAVGRLRGEEVHLDALGDRLRMRVGVDRDEEIGALLVGEVGPLAQRHEDVGAAGQRDLDAEALRHQPRDAPGHVEHHVLLLHAGGPAGAGVVAAVPRVEHDQPERLYDRAAVLAPRGSRPR